MTKQGFSSLGVYLLVGVMALPAWAQQAPHDAAYREPLVATTQQAAEAPPSATRPSLPVFAVQPTTGERVSQETATFLSRVAVQVASEKTGVSTPLPPSSYQPYRPGVSVPEPRTQERSCPPLGTPNPPTACIAR